MRIALQQDVLHSVWVAHKSKFRELRVAIVDSEDEDYCYIQELAELKPTMRARIVTASQYIAAGRWATHA